jgi:serine/threonine protein kinase
MQIAYDSKVPLGEGGYGSVFLGTYGGHQVAVKRVGLHLVRDIEEKALQRLDHPNVVKLIYSENDDNFK